MVVKFSSLIHVSLREDLEHAYIGDLQIELHEDVVELLKANGAAISCEMLKQYLWVKQLSRILHCFREHVSSLLLPKRDRRHHTFIFLSPLLSLLVLLGEFYALPILIYQLHYLLEPLHGFIITGESSKVLSQRLAPEYVAFREPDEPS